MLTEKELEQIHVESETLYPYPDDRSDTANLRLQEMKRRVFFSAVTKERERAKLLLDALPSVEIVDRLARSINAADPNGYDVIIKDLKKQVDKISNQYKNALKNYTNE